MDIKSTLDRTQKSFNLRKKVQLATLITGAALVVGLLILLYNWQPVKVKKFNEGFEFRNIELSPKGDSCFLLTQSQKEGSVLLLSTDSGNGWMEYPLQKTIKDIKPFWRKGKLIGITDDSIFLCNFTDFNPANKWDEKSKFYKGPEKNLSKIVVNAERSSAFLIGDTCIWKFDPSIKEVIDTSYKAVVRLAPGKTQKYILREGGQIQISGPIKDLIASRMAGRNLISLKGSKAVQPVALEQKKPLPVIQMPKKEQFASAAKISKVTAVDTVKAFVLNDAFKKENLKSTAPEVNLNKKALSNSTTIEEQKKSDPPLKRDDQKEEKRPGSDKMAFKSAKKAKPAWVDEKMKASSPSGIAEKSYKTEEPLSIKNSVDTATKNEIPIVSAPLVTAAPKTSSNTVNNPKPSVLPKVFPPKKYSWPVKPTDTIVDRPGTKVKKLADLGSYRYIDVKVFQNYIVALAERTDSIGSGAVIQFTDTGKYKYIPVRIPLSFRPHGFEYYGTTGITVGDSASYLAGFKFYYQSGISHLIDIRCIGADSIFHSLIVAGTSQDGLYNILKSNDNANSWSSLPVLVRKVYPERKLVRDIMFCALILCSFLVLILSYFNIKDENKFSAAILQKNKENRNDSPLAAMTDNPTANDTLGLFKPSIDAILEIMSNPSTNPPFTIVISGEWGSGKSSMMLQIKERLNGRFPDDQKEKDTVNETDTDKLSEAEKVTGADPDKKTLTEAEKEREKEKYRDFNTIWFNVWHYQSGEHLLATFLAKFLKSLESMYDGRYRLHLFRHRYKQLSFYSMTKIWFGLGILLPIVFVLINLITDSGIKPKLAGTELFYGAELFFNFLKEHPKEQPYTQVGFTLIFWLLGIFFLKKDWMPAGFSAITELFPIKELQRDFKVGETGYRDKYKNEFWEILRASKGKKNFVIFIDDTDRIEGGKVLELLESINFIADIASRPESDDDEKPKLFFIIAMSTRQVVHQLGLALKNDKDKNPLEDDPDVLGSRYMAKMVDMVVQVPTLDDLDEIKSCKLMQRDEPEKLDNKPKKDIMQRAIASVQVMIIRIRNKAMKAVTHKKENV